MTDGQNLLAEYVRAGSETAFRELVTRYVNLVYSTALRLVGGDSHRAEDVAQTVFLNLARAARTLPKDVKLGGWLHRDTCFVASTLMRGERRRQSRERQAAEMNALQTNSGADFSLIAPLLDEAINELGDADRTAILLRFFEQHDFRSVGEALGSNEDAARMRVTRALEKLEGFLKRRGVTTTAASLGVVLSVNAVQAAPVGLALTISTAAALAGSTLAATATSTATLTKAIAMTTLQKTLVTATVAVLAGVGIYEGRQAATLRSEVQTLQQQQAPLTEQNQQLVSDRDDLTSKLAALRGENERLNRNNDELLRLRGEATRLRNDSNELTRLRAEELQRANRQQRTNITEGVTGLKANEVTFQGYNTPIAALQSALASQWKGDRAAFLASLSTREQLLEGKRITDRMQRENKSQAEIEAADAAMIAKALPQLEEVRVMEERVDSADRATLRVRLLTRKNHDGGEWMEKELNFQKTGNEWKLDDGL